MVLFYALACKPYDGRTKEKNGSRTFQKAK
jgi:hypothetical protein